MLGIRSEALPHGTTKEDGVDCHQTMCDSTGSMNKANYALARFRSVAQFIRGTCVLLHAQAVRRQRQQRASGQPFGGAGGSGDQPNSDHPITATIEGAFPSSLFWTNFDHVSGSTMDAFGTATGATRLVPLFANALSVTKYRRHTAPWPGSDPDPRHFPDPDECADPVVSALEECALRHFEAAANISSFRRFALAVSVVAFFHEFGLGSIGDPNFAKAERLVFHSFTRGLMS
ncbi:hypothetical protein BC830DRAFT_345496 [Chytriomyces sp. MP71]|nr:hypothetical protein BC830DRAFT_345496 [Chytriomyces sp. MP71]